MTSFDHALEITGCESIVTGLRAKRRLWAGALNPMTGGWLLKQIMLEILQGAVRRGRSGKEKDWTDYLQRDIRAFCISMG